MCSFVKPFTGMWGMSRLSLVRRLPSNTCWSVISMLTSLLQLRSNSSLASGPGAPGSQKLKQSTQRILLQRLPQAMLMVVRQKWPGKNWSPFCWRQLKMCVGLPRNPGVKEHYECLSNVEFDWDLNSLMAAYAMEGPAPHIPLEMVIKSIKRMKYGKAAGTSLIVTEMLKASGVEGGQQIRDLIDDIHFRKIFTEWEESIIISLYKDKGVALERGNYQGLKLLNQVMKVLQRVVENFLWQQVHIHDMQFSFLPGRSTTDVIFIVRQLQGKFMPSIRHCTWPLLIWKRHLIKYPEVSSAGLFASLAFMSGWCVSYRACIKTPEAECVLVKTWVKSSVWKWTFT